MHRARAAARFDERGRLILLRDQDRSLWDREAVRAASELLLEAGRLRRAGPYQIQAAIVACHAEAESWEAADWPQILALYDALLALAPSPVASLNRAIALRYVGGPEAALAEVGRLGPALANYGLLHATRAELLRDLGRLTEARLADEQALALTTNPAERALLEQRLSEKYGTIRAWTRISATWPSSPTARKPSPTTTPSTSRCGSWAGPRPATSPSPTAS